MTDLNGLITGMHKGLSQKQVLARSGTIHIRRDDIVNGICTLDVSDKQIAELSANLCIAVIGGTDDKGACFYSLRLFKCKSRAEMYIAELLSEKTKYNYVAVKIHDSGQKIGKINNDIEIAWFEDEDSYADIVIDYLGDDIDVEEFYKQEIVNVKYIINSDYELTYSSSLLYINSRLYIDTHKCCVCWYGYDDLTYEKAISSALKDKVDYLNELAKKDYDNMVRYHQNWLN